MFIQPCSCFWPSFTCQTFEQKTLWKDVAAVEPRDSPPSSWTQPGRCSSSGPYCIIKTASQVRSHQGQPCWTDVFSVVGHLKWQPNENSVLSYFCHEFSPSTITCDPEERKGGKKFQHTWCIVRHTTTNRTPSTVWNFLDCWLISTYCGYLKNTFFFSSLKVKSSQSQFITLKLWTLQLVVFGKFGL